MNLERFKYVFNKNTMHEDEIPAIIPETPPRNNFVLSKDCENFKLSSNKKRRRVKNTSSEDEEMVYTKKKKSRITDFLGKKSSVQQPSSSTFISPDSGSDIDDAVRNNCIDDMEKDKIELSSSQRDSQNSVSSCESPLLCPRKKNNCFRLDSCEKDPNSGKAPSHDKKSSRRLGLSSSESENESDETVRPRGPFPRLSCVVSNASSESVTKPEQQGVKNIVNGHHKSEGSGAIASFYSKKNKIMAKDSRFESACLNEDNIIDENFEAEDDYSSSDEDQFAHLGKNRKKMVLEFFQNAKEEGLSTIQGCSKKKATIIIGLQPFKSWNDLVTKMSETKNLNIDLILRCSDLLRERKMLQSLLQECRSISEQLNTEIECLRLKEHMTKGKMVLKSPSTIPSHLLLKPYQLVGLNWIALLHRNGVNGVLADEMGLGKTVQTISFLAHLLENDPQTGPHLVIVPSSTLDNWVREFSLWCPSMMVVSYRGSQLERRHLRAEFLRENKTAHVILTTYNSAISTPEDRVFFKKIKIHYAVFDEGHMLKNMSSQRYMHLMKIGASKRLLLTGTPLQNNLLELMSLLRFVMPHMFEQTTDTLVRIFSSSTSDNNSKFAQDRIQDAKEIMQPFVLRRLKDDVLRQLPEKQNEILRCQMTSIQQLQYEETKELFRQKLHKKSASEMKNAFIELRKVANHPLLRRKLYTMDKLSQMAKLLKKEEQFRDSSESLMVEDMAVMTDFELNRFCREKYAIRKFALNENVLFNSGKFKKLDVILPEFKEKNERVVIFSQFTMIMDIIEKYLQRRKHKFVRLDGQTLVKTRLDIIDQFNRDESIFVFLLSTKAGGLGINLTSANIVILHDIDMNPYNDKQAEDRCHRLGQTKPVKIIRMITEDSIEEGMLRCAQKKLKLERDMTGNDDTNDIASLLEETLAT